MFEKDHTYGAALGLIRTFQEDFDQGRRLLELLAQNKRYDILEEVGKIVESENKKIQNNVNELYTAAYSEFPNHSSESVKKAIDKCWRNKHNTQQEAYSGKGLEDELSIKKLEQYTLAIEQFCDKIYTNAKIVQAVVNKLSKNMLEAATKPKQQGICTLV